MQKIKTTSAIEYITKTKDATLSEFLENGGNESDFIESVAKFKNKNDIYVSIKHIDNETVYNVLQLKEWIANYQIKFQSGKSFWGKVVVKIAIGLESTQYARRVVLERLYVTHSGSFSLIRYNLKKYANRQKITKIKKIEKR